MQVYKAYFKIVKSVLPIIISYILIFAAISVLTTLNRGSENNTFESSKINIAYINKDQESPFLNSFYTYLDENFNILEIENDDKSLRDALFFRKVEYIVIVPPNFTNKFLSGESIQLETLNVPDSSGGLYAESIINKYFNIAKLYVKADLSEDVIASKVLENLKEEVSVDFKTNQKNSTELFKASLYFNYTNYVFLALLITVIALIMSTFNSLEIKRRNIVSPLKTKDMNFQLMLGNLSISIIIWLVFAVGSMILFNEVMLTTQGLLFYINSFVFVLTVLSIGFLIGISIKSLEIQNAIANVISLGTSFISGAFVPQMYLGKFILGIAAFLPSYWFIKANNLIESTIQLNSEFWQSFILCIVVQMIFMIIIYMLAFFISKKRKTIE